MLRFFRSSKTIVVVIVLLTGVLTWLHVLSNTETIADAKYGSFLFVALSASFADIPEIGAIAGFVLLILTAFLLIPVNTKLNLIDKYTYLPALCYILLIGGMPEIHIFNPAIIAVILLITSFSVLVKTFENERLSYNFFTIPVIISFATFLYQYMYVYMLVVWLVLALWRPGYWREWVFSILGFSLPLFFAFSWFFLIEDDVEQMVNFFNEMFNIQHIIINVSISNIIFLGIVISLVIISFAYILRYVASKKIAIRTGYYILILFIVVTTGLIVIVPDIFPQIWYLLSFPLSYIISSYLATVKSKVWGTTVLAAIFAGVIVAQFIL